MRNASGASILALVLLTTPALATGPTGSRPAACAVTAPNHRVPPASVLARANTFMPEGTRPAGELAHGNGHIWTNLWPDGVITFRKGGTGFILPDGSLQMKFLWFVSVDRPLQITGRRLDGPAPALKVGMTSQPPSSGFQPSALAFPTTGCWEVTAKAGGSPALTFVTAVVKEGW